MNDLVESQPKEGTLEPSGRSMQDRTVPPAAYQERLVLGPIVAGAVALVVVLLLPVMGANNYVMGLVLIAAIYAIVAVSWDLVLGRAGLFTFCQMSFFAIGAYSSALLVIHLGISPWASLPIAILLAGIVGTLVGLPCLRLSGPYLVMFTLAFQMMMYALLVTDQTGITGGAAGLSNFAVWTIPGVGETQAPYYVAVIAVAVAVVVVRLLVRSPIGIAAQALRDNEPVTVARGVGRTMHRLILFAVSAALSGMAGAVYAHSYGQITPTVLDLNLLILIMAMVIIGGSCSIPGVILGTALLVYLGDFLATQAQYSTIIWGAVIVVVVFLFPRGIGGLLRTIKESISGTLNEWFGES